MPGGSWGVHGPGEVHGPVGVHGPRGGAWSRGLVVSQHALRQTPPVNRMTNRCKNITLPQTSFAGGKNAIYYKISRGLIAVFYWFVTTGCG